MMEEKDSNVPARERLFRDKSNLRNSENLEKVREHQLYIEYKVLRLYMPSGIYMLPMPKDIRTWKGGIYINKGLYRGGMFRFEIRIPVDYPNSAPEFCFTNYVFHPLVDNETGRLNTKPKFPEWKPKKDFLFILLNYAKSIFFKKEFWTEQYLENSVAFDVFKNNLELFEKEAYMCAENSQNSSQEPDYIEFHRQLIGKVKNSACSEEDQCKALVNWFKQNYLKNNH